MGAGADAVYVRITYFSVFSQRCVVDRSHSMKLLCSPSNVSLEGVSIAFRASLDLQALAKNENAPPEVRNQFATGQLNNYTISQLVVNMTSQ